MNKTLLTSIIIVILLIGAFLYFNKYIYNKKQGQQTNMTTTQNSQSNGDIEVTPIEHATMVLKWDGKVIYTDPEGGAEAFAGQPSPDLILLTDIHGDHFNLESIEAVTKENTVIIAPKVVVDELPKTLTGKIVLLSNTEKTTEQGFSVEAIPMYNLPESVDSKHTKGRGNGYVIEKDATRVYVSGDTDGIPEMRNLQNIDMAFVAMNLPNTMGVQEAASAVSEFKPKKVYPYHYRISGGFSDVAKFKELVNASDPNIEVVLLNWYKN